MYVGMKEQDDDETIHDGGIDTSQNNVRSNRGYTGQRPIAQIG
jgi:hypothetical protein